MNELEIVRQYIERTKIPTMERYTLSVNTWLALATAARTLDADAILDAVALAFKYGRAKGYRAGKAACGELNSREERENMIQLTDNLYMTADERSFIVGKLRKTPGKGRLIASPTYYPTAEAAARGALLRALRQKVADGSITTLRQFIEEQERLNARFEEMIAPLMVSTPR